MRNYLLTIIIAVVLCGCGQHPEIAVILSSAKGEIVDFAQAELMKFVEQGNALKFADN